MKLAATLVLIMALGLSTYGQEFSNDAVEVASPEAEDFLDNLLNDDDDEIVDMDDALNKYRMLKEISLIFAKAEAMEMINPKKRFVSGFFDKVKDALKKAAKKVGDFFTRTWNYAKVAFNKIISKGLFVHPTIPPFIHPTVLPPFPPSVLPSVLPSVDPRLLDFKATVNKLIPYIHSGMTVAACKALVVAAASRFLGPAAAVAGLASEPLCDAALAKLEDVAG